MRVSLVWCMAVKFNARLHRQTDKTTKYQGISISLSKYPFKNPVHRDIKQTFLKNDE